MSQLHVVLPGDIDDPATPSGGNTYDRRVCDGLRAAGWTVREHAVHGGWPRPAAAERAALAAALAGLPDGALVLLDGLIASTVPAELAPHAWRLRLVVLVHMPLDGDAEAAALAAARTVLTTSEWTRGWLLRRYRLAADRVHAAPPGVDPAPLASGSATGTELLCVAAVTPQKGHDRLVRALAAVNDLPWRCVCVGALTRDPDFVDRLNASASGLADRLQFAGPRTGDALDAAYTGADLLVLASRGETYGMVATEALARGIPVLATAAGGLPEAVGHAPDGSVPALLVPVEGTDEAVASALAGALRRWLVEPDLRDRLRRSARARRDSLPAWQHTTDLVAKALDSTKEGDPVNAFRGKGSPFSRRGER